MSVYYISDLEKPKNDGGVVIKASTTGNVLSNVPAILNPEELPFGSTVVINVNTKSALSIGNFAYNNQEPIVKGFSTSLNGGSFSSSAVDISSTGNASTNLTSGIHPISTVRTRLVTTAFRENRFNEITGKFEAGYPDVQLDNLRTDLAANPTRDNPGRITFTYGKQLINTGYYPKTG